MSDSPSEPVSFEQALADLEKIVRDLEDGQTGLEAALTRYETGVGLLKHCYGHLRAAEQRVLQLTGVDADGRPLLQPFEHRATEGSTKGDGVKERRRKPLTDD
jgi:exodeoxyribonuclease VII small subunit